MRHLFRISRFAKRLKSSLIRELLKLANTKGIISFAGGLPSPQLFKKTWIIKAVVKIFLTDENPLGYEASEGNLKLRTTIAEIYQSKGIPVDPEEIVVTSGAQQGLDLLGTCLVNAGDPVITEKPSFAAFFSAIKGRGAKIATISMEEDGIDVDLLEIELAKAERAHKLPKMIYIIPTFQNPSGITTSLKKRKKIIFLARKYDVPIVEDNPYGELRYDGKEIKSLFELAPDIVINVRTFSKDLGLPGFRIGWLVIKDEKFRNKVVQAIQGKNLCGSKFCQLIVNELLEQGTREHYIAKAIPYYKEKKDFALKCLKKYMPDGVYWTRPEGGLFLWITLPKGITSQELFDKVSHRVVFVTGNAFKGGDNQLRFNFSYPSLKEIEEGIKFMAEELRKLMMK